MRRLDRIDKRLLQRLQQNSQLGMAELGDAVGLSASACHRRVRQLEADGVITGYSARVDPEALGLQLQFIIEITLASQTRQALDDFEAAVQGLPQVLQCLLMSGQSDYRLHVVVRDTDDFERLYREHLSLLPGVSRIESSLVLRTVRERASLPVDTPG